MRLHQFQHGFRERGVGCHGDGSLDTIPLFYIRICQHRGTVPLVFVFPCSFIVLSTQKNRPLVFQKNRPLVLVFLFTIVLFFHAL
jgi:hypothetical protein